MLSMADPDYPPALKRITDPPAHSGLAEGIDIAARNRLQTALAALTTLVQSDTASGTLTTAAHALEQHRPLAVVVPPGEERDHPANAGNLALLAHPTVRPVDPGAIGVLFDEIA